MKTSAWMVASLCAVLLSMPGELCAAEWFVATNGSDAAAGTNWATAKITIQAAIDAANSNDAVWASNGLYATGGRVVYGAMTNRVAIDKPITVQSVNGPEVTVIRGAWDPITINGDAAVRCVYLGTNAVLSGFTLTNGATRKGGDQRETAGGGACCETSSIMTNCIVIGNSAKYYGGGVFRGALYNCNISGNINNERGGGTCESTLYNCTLSGNSAAAGGGAALGRLDNCTLIGNSSAPCCGGGTWYATLNSCTLTSNSAERGGGAYCGTLNDCVLTGNSAASGGGAWEATLNNCTLVGNSATGQTWFSSGFGGGSIHGILNGCTLSSNTAQDSGGGSCDCTLNNCTVAGNSAGSYGGGAYVSTLNNCAVISNAATEGGGGSRDSTLNNCTVSKNIARYGGGSLLDTLNNCIVYNNETTLIIILKVGGNHDSSTFNYCCTTPNPGGIGNITDDPQFVDAAAGNYRLQTNSPCIDRGNNTDVLGMTDLDGIPRILNGTVDMGAYEVQLYTGYRAWAAAVTNGLTNDLDCAAGDDVPNLLRYAVGSPHPMVPDGFAQLDGTSADGMPKLVFNRNSNATDITLVVQGAEAISDEATWRGLATNINGSWGGANNVCESGTGNPVVVTVEDPAPFRTNRFLRLKVTRP